MLSIAFRLLLGIVVVAAIANRVVPVAGHRRRLPTSSMPPTNCQSMLSHPSPTVATSPATDNTTPGPTPPVPAVPAKMGVASYTAHGRLVLDGHFAHRIGLLTAFKEMALPGKTVVHAPAEHLVTAFVNVLAGHTQLQEISRGSHPLRPDLNLSHAWGQPQFPEVSGVCRHLHACDWTQAEAVRGPALGGRQVFAPYIALCTPMERLRLITEAALGHPRRRPELMAGRISRAEVDRQECQQRVSSRQDLVRAQEERVRRLAERSQTIATRQAARSPEQQALAARDEHARAGVEERLNRAQHLLEGRRQRLRSAEVRLAEAQQFVKRLQQRRQHMEAENLALDAGKGTAITIELIMDSQFGDSGKVADLYEEGYELTTKAISAATMAKLQRRQEKGEALFGPWEAVSANAEVARLRRESTYADCPYPLRLVGYRKHLAASASRPAQTSYALFVTTISAQERPAQETVQHYHVRGGTVELLNRQAKSYLGWRGHSA